MKDIKKFINNDKIELIKDISIIIIMLYPVIILLWNELFINANIYVYGIMCIALTIGIIVVIWKNTVSVIKAISIYILIIIINYIFHINTINQSLSIIIKNFITCYLIFTIIICINDIEKFLKSLKFGGYITVILILMYILLMKDRIPELLTNGLSLQLCLIMFLPINVVFAFKERKKIDMIFSIIGLIIISCFSSRTIIATIWLFVLILATIYYIKYYKTVTNKNKRICVIIMTLIFLMVMIIAITNIKALSTVLYAFLTKRGIYVRTLRLLAEGEYLLNSSGRVEQIYPIMIEKISKAPFIGNGIGMDRVIINENIYYAHNIILELFVSYGIIIGSIIIIAITILIVRALRTEYDLFILAFIFYGIIILLLTTTYTEYRGFWIMLAMLININKKIKRKVEQI